MASSRTHRGRTSSWSAASVGPSWRAPGPPPSPVARRSHRAPPCRPPAAQTARPKGPRLDRRRHSVTGRSASRRVTGGPRTRRRRTRGRTRSVVARTLPRGRAPRSRVHQTLQQRLSGEWCAWIGRQIYSQEELTVQLPTIRAYRSGWAHAVRLGQSWPDGDRGPTLWCAHSLSLALTQGRGRVTRDAPPLERHQVGRHPRYFARRWCAQ